MSTSENVLAKVYYLVQDGVGLVSVGDGDVEASLELGGEVGGAEAGEEALI